MTTTKQVGLRPRRVAFEACSMASAVANEATSMRVEIREEMDATDRAALEVAFVVQHTDDVIGID